MLSDTATSGPPSWEGPGGPDIEGSPPKPFLQSLTSKEANQGDVAGLSSPPMLAANPDSRAGVRTGAITSSSPESKPGSQSSRSPGGSTSGVTIPAWSTLPSVFRTASWTAEAHCQDIPSLAETMGLMEFGGDNPSLPVNPSRIPVKILASRKGVAA